MKRTLGEIVFDVFNAIFLLLLCVIMAYPFIHVTSIAFSSYQESLRIGLHIWPREIDLSSFEKVFRADEIWLAYYNTLWRTLIGTMLSVLVTALGGYAVSKHFLPLRRTIMVFFLFAMYFSGGVIPQFLLMRSLGLMNNRWAMVLPSLVWGFNMIVMRNFFLALPSSMEESAEIDGANEWIVFFRIVLPLSLPVVATVAMWMGVYHWNAYMDNLMYFTDKSKFVLQRVIRSIVISRAC